MCNPADIQHKIHSFTKDGEHIARFLTETMQGKTPGVKVNHRLEAAKHLIRYGFPDAVCETTPDRLSRAGGNPVGEGQGGDETPVQSPLSPGERVRVRGNEIDNPPQPVTHLDIINYQIAHLTRHETADGHTIVNFLIHIMTGRDRPFTPKKFRIKPADRIAAARELLRRGFGDLGSRRRKSDSTDEANAYDTLHTDLARRMREYSERGTDTVRFLLEVMSDPDPDLEFTIHHRMSAAQELLRRGWDTNYDNIKPKHLQAYWRDKESTRLSIGQKKTQAGLSTTIDDYDNYDDVDYEAIAKEIREEEDRDDNSKPLRFQETASSSRHSSESRNPEDHQAATPATKLPLPQGEGWGEGKETNAPSTPTLPKSLPPAKAGARMGVTEPASNEMLQSESGSTATSKLPLPEGEGWGEGSDNSLPPRRGKVRMGVKNPAQSPLPNKAATVNEQDKAIIKEFQEAMASGDHRAALRAKAKFIGKKVAGDLQPYVAPDPNLQPNNRPFDKEEQAKFDEEPSPPIAPTDYPDPEMQIAGAATNGTSVICAPPAEKLRAPAIRSP